MSCAIDVNVLLYASDRDSIFAERAQVLLSQLASGRDPVCLAWSTIMAYLRISTHGSVFAHPLSPEEALCNVETLLQLPHLRVLVEEEGFWAIYREIATGVPVRGNLVPDAHLAALLRLHGVNILYSNDRDFRKFDFLRVRNPFAVSSQVGNRLQDRSNNAPAVAQPRRLTGRLLAMRDSDQCVLTFTSWRG